MELLSVDERESVEKEYDSLFILECDEEGRVILLEYENTFLFNIYFPAGTEWVVVIPRKE